MPDQPDQPDRDGDADERLGRYSLVRRLGKGGMGEVFLAKAQGARGFEKLVAIKRILPQYNANRHVVNMLVDEARISVLLNHPNVVQVLELDEDAGSHYIVMEYVDGHALSRLIRRLKKRGERVEPFVACYVMIQVLEGLHAAHTQHDGSGRPANIIHRDVSPQNVLISMSGQVKVIDFGIARARDRLEATQGSQVKGKLRYMAPEQIKPSLGGSLGIDHRVDVFAGGVVLFELLAMRQRFPQTGDLEIVDAILESETPDLRTEGIVDDDLMAILDTALARERRRRYKDAAAFAADLRSYLYARDPAFNGERLARLMRRCFLDEDDTDVEEPAPQPQVRRGKMTVKPSPVASQPLHDVGDVEEETRTQFRPMSAEEEQAAPALRGRAAPGKGRRGIPAPIVGALIGAVVLVGAGFAVRTAMKPTQLTVVTPPIEGAGTGTGTGTGTGSGAGSTTGTKPLPPPPPPPPLESTGPSMVDRGEGLFLVVEVEPATATISRAYQPDPKYVSPARLPVKQGETVDLQFEAAGFESLRQKFLVNGDDPRVRVELTPIPMPLIIRPVPRDAEVTVNGDRWRSGRTVNPNETLVITARHPFYLEESRTIVAKPGQNVIVDITLQERSMNTDAPDTSDDAAPRRGFLKVTSTPEDADIFVDGIKMGKTPTTLKVAPGSHRVTVRGSGAETTFAVELKAGETIKRDIPLQ